MMRRELAGPTGADGHAHEGDGGGICLAAEQVLDDLLALARRQVRVGEGGAELVGALEGPGEAEQLVADAGDVALGPGDVEHRSGVGGGAVVRHGQVRFRSLGS